MCCRITRHHIARIEAYGYSLGVSYDAVENLADGATYSWTAPSAAQTVATDTTATCTGHRLYSVDPETGALTLAMIAMVDCQRKTADRVKDLHAAKDRVLWIGRFIWGVAAGGGFALLAKVLKVLGVL